MLPNDTINPLFQATVEATEEAIINALVAGRDMVGNGGSVVKGIDHNRLVDVLRHHQRIVEP
jgi:D-aminopeptidase